MLDSLIQGSRVVVIGASGGIGAAFVEHLEQSPKTGTIYAFSRRPLQSAADKTVAGRIDVTDEDSIETAAAEIADEGPVDLVIVASGLLHAGPGLWPEKSLRELTPDNLARSFAVNAVGPAIVAKHFLPLMRRGHKSVFAALSARIGSIEDNRLGGWASYRASKAALNMLIKTLSIEQARRNPDSVVAALHPGTVDTQLSKPFSRRAPKLFSPHEAARHLLKVIDELTPEDTGSLVAWSGERISF